jgi:hypothetical protein
MERNRLHLYLKRNLLLQIRGKSQKTRREEGKEERRLNLPNVQLKDEFWKK